MYNNEKSRRGKVFSCFFLLASMNSWKLFSDTLDMVLFHSRRVRATAYLCVKRERSLITTYSLYSENIMHFDFYLKHVR